MHLEFFPKSGFVIFDIFLDEQVHAGFDIEECAGGFGYVSDGVGSVELQSIGVSPRDLGLLFISDDDEEKGIGGFLRPAHKRCDDKGEQGVCCLHKCIFDRFFHNDCGFDAE